MGESGEAREPWRWMWLALCALICVGACGVVLVLQDAEHDARARELDARLFATRIEQTSVTLAPVALQLAATDRPLLMRTVRRMTSNADRQLDAFAKVAPAEAEVIRREVAAIDAFARAGELTPETAVRVTTAAARITSTADAVAAKQRHRAEAAERLSLLGGILALGLSALLVGMLVGRDRRRTIEQERAHAEALVAASETDPLTGLPNRIAFARHLQVREAAQAPTEVVVCDLNDFKEINHRLGHEAGDAVLMTVAADLDAAVGSDARVYRTGGDQFALLGEPGAQLAERVRVVFERDRERALGSVGAASWPADHEAMRDVVRLADQRMYAIKRVLAPLPISLAPDEHADAA